MQISSSGWFPNLIKVITGLTSAFGHFLGHLAATTKAWRYKRYKHNRKLPFHRLSAASGVLNMQRSASGWFGKNKEPEPPKGTQNFNITRAEFCVL